MSKTEQNKDFILKNLLAKIKEFPTLPTVYTKLVTVMDNPNCTVDDIANVIASDQSSAMKILKLSNSAIYGHAKRIKSINEAVFIIGTREIKSIVLTLAIIKLFEGATKTGSFDPLQFWDFSFAVGSISRNLAKELKIKNHEDLFVAGIIHGIGKLFLIIGIPELYSNVINAAKMKKMDLKEVEKLVLGITHSVIARLLVEKWNLPLDFAIMFDNMYSGLYNGKFHSYATTVHLSVVAASMLKIGDSGSDLIPNLNKDIWKEVDINPKFFSNNIEQIKKEVIELKMLLGS